MPPVRTVTLPQFFRMFIAVFNPRSKVNAEGSTSGPLNNELPMKSTPNLTPSSVVILRRVKNMGSR